MGTSISSFIEKYSACHNYISALENLPPTYDISDSCGTCPIPDPSFYNDAILNNLLQNVNDAEKNCKELGLLKNK